MLALCFGTLLLFSYYFIFTPHGTFLVILISLFHPLDGLVHIISIFQLDGQFFLLGHHLLMWSLYFLSMVAH